MPSIEEFLYPLHEGIWEVIIPRDQVTEPLGDGWLSSPINIPTPGTIASYRKGQYHLHETATDLRIHLDRYDPKKHPILHLIDDAPLLLMISETFITLISFTRSGTIHTLAGELQNQTKTYRNHIILGVLAIFLGIIIVAVPDLTFLGLTTLIIPGIVLIFGLITVRYGVGTRPLRITDRNDIIRGAWIIGGAMILGSFSPIFWGAIILAGLAGWMFATSLILLRRILKGRKAVPEGFLSRLIIGAASLMLAICICIAPVSVLMIGMDILGILIIILGLVSILIGIRLRVMMQENRDDPRS
ncbi:MAG: hypothetical protein LUQ50_05570 [Methanospirillum sp.]|uniref:hypothetical protein n=1 Tax=Methanospirillum sp. TaxID=45200 RepID=UPI002373AE23|nr:hypothetical protein [Methanospirillum sp.]MDD1728520.1 hypothetical protein [Methanospirillum sp.]